MCLHIHACQNGQVRWKKMAFSLKSLNVLRVGICVQVLLGYLHLWKDKRGCFLFSQISILLSIRFRPNISFLSGFNFCTSFKIYTLSISARNERSMLHFLAVTCLLCVAFTIFLLLRTESACSLGFSTDTCTLPLTEMTKVFQSAYYYQKLNISANGKQKTYKV